ncbi:hypothetical protein AKJ16_DCAP06131 [Drosera capensis]
MTASYGSSLLEAKLGNHNGLPKRLLCLYFPMGNLATGFFVTFSLLVGVLGVTTSLTGIYNVIKGTPPYLHAAAASSAMVLRGLEETVRLTGYIPPGTQAFASGSELKSPGRRGRLKDSGDGYLKA